MKWSSLGQFSWPRGLELQGRCLNGQLIRRRRELSASVRERLNRKWRFEERSVMPAPGSLTVSETYSPPFAGGSAAQPPIH